MINTVNSGRSLAPTGEKRLTLYDLTWQHYPQILQALLQTRATQLTYDRGTLDF